MRLFFDENCDLHIGGFVQSIHYVFDAGIVQPKRRVHSIAVFQLDAFAYSRDEFSLVVTFIADSVINSENFHMVMLRRGVVYSGKEFGGKPVHFQS